MWDNLKSGENVDVGSGAFDGEGEKKPTLPLWYLFRIFSKNVSKGGTLWKLLWPLPSNRVRRATGYWLIFIFSFLLFFIFLLSCHLHSATYQATNVKINFVSESSTTTTSQKIVTYSVTATTTTTVDTDTVKTTVHQTITDAHLTGMQIGAQTDAQSDSGSSDATADQGQTTESTNGTDATSADSDTDTTSGTKPYVATDSATLTYTTTKERDQLLQQILKFWLTALSRFLFEKKIVFIIRKHPLIRKTKFTSFSASYFFNNQVILNQNIIFICKQGEF